MLEIGNGSTHKRRVSGQSTIHTLAAAAIDVDTVTKDIASIAAAFSITSVQREKEAN